MKCRFTEIQQSYTPFQSWRGSGGGPAEAAEAGCGPAAAAQSGLAADIVLYRRVKYRRVKCTFCTEGLSVQRVVARPSASEQAPL
jgi:hypothetical protein